jgi:LmbE family N-acetylglucosaminyl deacetylase
VNITVIVPHGDDEVLGFGGVIQKLSLLNHSITVVVCEPPADKRSQEQLLTLPSACTLLGAQNTILLNKEIVDTINFFQSVEQCLIKTDPSIVYTTFYGDNHQDHKTVFNCVSRAVRTWGPLNVKQFFAGEILSSTDQSPKIAGNIFLPNYYEILSAEQVNIKKQALNLYKTEIRSFPHPRSSEGVEILAKARGMEAGTEYAEAFMCIKNIS